ncbi:MAG TPA: transporter substrate-binding domain-containing protein [Ramlibacter sp.]|uniref:transporter substrate-binding domain-containing protein n=1 Tax=Ramlibacter sp. TaxID=1917967 RepID=UPI002C30E073|nr:transporter substrate-binding domain-containing protein [Ramlibacter sp.]HVZ46818.1 transporter substrate-binding domain-containing protein [Ramlibacter sp.]
MGIVIGKTARLGGLLAAFALAAPAAFAAGQCNTVEKVRAKGGWEIVTQVPQFEPYWFADEKGNLQGMDYDMLVEVNKILNIPKTNYTTVAWAGVLPALQAGKSDFVPEAIAVTEARKKTFGFVYPEGDNSIVILTRADTGVKGPADLVGKTVGVEIGSAGEATALKLKDKAKASGKDIDVKAYQHNVDELLDLGNRRIDAVLLNVAPVVAYMKKHPGKFVNAGLADTPLYAAWVFRKEDFGGPGCIGDEVNRALKILREKGTTKALQIKWFDHEMPLPDYATWKSVE